MDRLTVMQALVGSHNYNLAQKDSDRDYKVFVLPTFEDLYHNRTFHEQTITKDCDHDIHDIRKLPMLLYKSNINYLEIFASNDLHIFNRNEELEEIYALKKDIFKINLPYLYNACRGMHKQKMNLLGKGTEGTQHLVDRFGYDTKQALHAYRCLKVVVDFEANNFESFEDAIRYDGDDLQFMLEIRNGEFKREVFENFIKHYFESTFDHLQDKYHSFEPNKALYEKIDNLIMSLIKRKLIEE